MADLIEPANPGFPGVYQLELTDRVKAGAGGISNRQAEQLVERTGFLKKKVDDLVSGALTAKSAEHLAAPRNLAMTGDGAWSVTFDGSGNASAAMTLANTGVGAGSYGVVTVDAKGRVIAGRPLEAADVPWLREKFAAASAVNELAAQVANKADRGATLAGYGITDALQLQPDIAAPVDLDTIIASGSYPNPANVNAANGKNWPCPQAGNLTVRQAGEFVYQVYQAFADGGFWHRCRYQGRWNPWRRLADAAAIQDGIAAATPPGQIAYFARDTPPPGWLICAGAQDVARTAYAALFAAIGDRFGAGDGRTTFGVPDLRGEFVRGWDAGRNVDASRVFGSGQASQNLWHDHAIPTPGSTTGGDTVRTDNGGTGLDAGARHTSNEFLTEFGTGRQLRYATYGSGGSESRPRNIALLACIKI
ncbi:tail fiber protein [Chromobacterium subtsugae]|uniref:Tail fiber protein n=1 Tax=Chromobacterium subtsugae TaxID=251747 RepID=A0ABS7FCM0_9NEIS|nr:MULTISPECIES: phage tail protein [Chromobacterium]KUM04218.1 hypothetical protein Cv017_15815 [Chromobacterium subtsugae]KZE85191.1 hypothetical protein AWB61_20720 [Chromobacterium sp. F49]MBW7566302.1 tail fiber protein [Chromobacterium subtsugae]MBW8287839.1 tail fiber protein [Chromobacterium subtsugae]WSE91168.1 tail fiber protein [Chromobacterium subtsugae]